VEEARAVTARAKRQPDRLDRKMKNLTAREPRAEEAVA
jgi:hypothetical protein